MQAAIDFLQTMPFWYWWVFAALLLVIELGTGSTYFLWPAIAAVFVGIFALLPFSAWQMELLLFAIVTTALSFWAPARIKPWLHRTQTDHQTLNERGAQKIGRHASVDEGFVNGTGKVRLGDTLWLAEAEEGVDFAAGTDVIVTRTEGVKLFVTGA